MTEQPWSVIGEANAKRTSKHKSNEHETFLQILYLTMLWIFDGGTGMKWGEFVDRLQCDRDLEFYDFFQLFPSKAIKKKLLREEERMCEREEQSLSENESFHFHDFIRRLQKRSVFLASNF